MQHSNVLLWQYLLIELIVLGTVMQMVTILSNFAGYTFFLQSIKVLISSLPSVPHAQAGILYFQGVGHHIIQSHMPIQALFNVCSEKYIKCDAIIY